MADTPELTRILAGFAIDLSWEDLPEAVQAKAVQDCVNYVGCVLGGARQDAVERTFRAAKPFAGGPQATVAGRAETLGLLEAAMVNCQASAAYAYDDTHLATVLHPAGPVAAPLFAEAEAGRRHLSGKDVLTGLAVGVEISCRVAKMLAAPPAEAEVGWYMTSVASPIGAAAGAARALGLDRTAAMHAFGIAAGQAAGFRQSHGSMMTSLSPALASRAGYWAAALAKEGVTASEAALEGPHGFAALFAPAAHLAHGIDGLGEDWEMLANMAKPYPCGIVIHPVLDACLEIAGEPGFDAAGIARVGLGVHPLCLTLTDRPSPPNAQLAQVSVQHWAAAALVRGKAGIEEGEAAAVDDPAIVAARRLVRAEPDASVATDGAVVRVEMTDGAIHERRVDHGVGSLQRPMSNGEIDAKFMAQATRVLSKPRARKLLAVCRDVASLDEASTMMRTANPE